MDMKYLPIVGLLLLCLAFLIPDAKASQSRQHDRYEVLLIGNSHSATHNLPSLIRKLIEHGVPGVPVHTELAPGSGFLADRIGDSVTQPAIDSRAWTHVVLQAQKYSSSGLFDYPTLAAEEFIRRIRARDGLPVMFPEWPREGNTEEGPRIHQLHMDIASREAACVAPIGLAWEVSLVVNPGIHLHHADGNHGNLNGAMLTAYVLYEVITGEPASALTYQDNLGVDASIQNKLRVVASQVVQENRAHCAAVALVADPPVLDFGESVDLPPSVQSVELVNNGLYDLRVTSIANPEAPFDVTTGGSCQSPPFALARAQSCTVEVMFSSQASGSFEGALEIQTQELTETIIVQLRGASGANLPALTPGHSAAFFNVLRDGEGQLVEMLDANTAVVYTFTHRPDGSGSMWFIGVGNVVGESIVVDQLLRPSGTSFGENFDPASIVNASVGEQSLEFSDCESDISGVNVEYSGDPDMGLEALNTDSGRLSNILGCGSISPHPNAGLSGSYYLPTRSGEGIVVQWLPDGQVLVYFFTYDLDNNQQWVLGIGQSDGTSVTMDALYASGNTVWGADFDPNEVVLSPWGTIELVWTECGRVRFSYDSGLEGYGSAIHEYGRLSSLWETNCPSFNQALAD